MDAREEDRMEIDGGEKGYSVADLQGADDMLDKTGLQFGGKVAVFL